MKNKIKDNILTTRRLSQYLTILSLVVFFLSSLGLALGPTEKVDAAPVTGFNAGRIIDDAVFTNASSMNTNQIQAFLNSKVPVCETWHAPGYGQNPPFTCLKDYQENGKNAAQIINDTAQQYQINPQVLIVLLQKEQGLVTDTWPLQVQYRSATGYGCPDTAPCDSQYYGLTNQLQWAARMFRSIMNASPSWYSPYVLGNNYIRWSPDAACGGSIVNIQNRATQALYNYTPYQPNQSALNAGYGKGDNCGAYGNRNFYLYFSDWFGSGYIPPNQSDITWKFEDLKSSSTGILPASTQTGITPKSITHNNDIYTFFYDATSRSLRAAKATTTGWSEITIDGIGSTALGSSGDDVGLYPSSLVYQNKLYVFYYDQTHGDIKVAILNNSTGTWSVERLDGSGGTSNRISSNTGIRPSVTQFGDSLQLFYYDASGGNLRHAWTNNGNTWNFEHLDGKSSITGHKNNVGINPSVTQFGDSLQLFYYDASGGNLRHAWTTTTQGWRFEDLDGTASSPAGYNSDAGVDVSTLSTGSHGTLAVFYKANNMLRYAHTGALGWRFAFLDGNTYAINSVSPQSTGINPTAVVYGNGLQLYYQEQGKLRHAWGNY